MFNQFDEMKLMAERRRDLLRAARMHQLYREADENRAQLGDRLMTLIGDLMISGGTRLKEHAGCPIEAHNLQNEF
ncbi:MAG TPA: hypothetical protein VHD90_12875 [Phototrophicaceae bacterium]|nr:hypothetical protein [Phototrophicaceae bacterium]